jgi:hypothetical protein
MTTPSYGHRILHHSNQFDDGTLDGNQRVDPGTGADYTIEDADGDGGLGDGQIDMSDFRRWRDWLLLVDSSPSLDGSASHPKKDVNGNGVTERAFDENIFVRGLLDNVKSVISLPGPQPRIEIPEHQ